MKQLTIMLISLIAILITQVLLGCGPVRNTAFGEQTHAEIPANIISPIISNEATFIQAKQNEPVAVSLFTDSHANYSDLKKVAQRIQGDPSKFVINLGDMTDLGLAVEYDAFLYSISPLKKPLFSVIGNHDSVGSGKSIYRRIFGSSNYAFDYSGVRWIFFNNNRLDFIKEGIDLNWLELQVQQSPYPVLIFQHVNPFNIEYFDQAYLERFKSILDTGKVNAVFFGHIHVNTTTFYKKTLLQSFARVQGEQYHHLIVEPEKIKVENCQGGRCESQSYYFGADQSVVLQ